MEPILSLPPAQFRAALAELNLPRDRADALRRQYRLQNSPLAGLYGLLDRAGQGEEGMQAATFLPVSRPEGMSVADAIRSGEAGIAVPQGLLDAVGGVARALDAPSAAAAGLIPREDMIGEALGTAGMAMGAGGLLSRRQSGVQNVDPWDNLDADDFFASVEGVSGPSAPRSVSAAQEVAALLRQGRAGEVTDELMSQADPQELARLYVNGETGIDMPMDYESRMARAVEMGFDPNQNRFHGTNFDFDSFRGNAFSTDNPTLASTYALGVDNSQIYPLLTRATNGDVNVSGGGRRWAEIDRGMINDPEVADALPPGSVFSTDVISWQARNQGRSGVTFEDIFDVGRGVNSSQFNNVGYSPQEVSRLRDNYLRDVSQPALVDVRMDPTQVRSRFARFDPRLSHLANLNAANIDPLTGAAAMGASQQQQDPLASLRAYLAATGGVLGR